MRILVDTEMPNNWKVRRFARILGDPLAGWYLIRLWAWAFNQARDGDLSRFQAAEIAMAAQYTGRPTRLIRVLVEVGLLDPDPLRIHDWEAHNGHHRSWYDNEAERKRDERQRKREDEVRRRAELAARQPQQTPEIPDGVPPDVPADVPPDVPLSPPCPALPGSGSGSPDGDSLATTTTPAPTAAAGKRGGGGVAKGDGDRRTGPEGFERWWRVYPKNERHRRAEAMREWVAQDLEPDTDEIIAFTESPPPHWERAPQPRWVPNPVMFLRRGDWRSRRLRTSGGRRATDPPPRPAKEGNGVEVYADTGWRPQTPPPSGGFKDFLKELAEKKVLS